MIKAGLVCAILGLTLVATQSSASKIDLSTDLSPSEQTNVEAYVNYVDSLEGILATKLSENDDPEENMKALKELLSSMDSGVFNKSRKGKKAAFELVAALESASEQCDHGSFKIFAQNYLLNYQLLAGRNINQLRTNTMFNHYHEKQVDKCRAFYREEYHKLVKTIDPSVLQRMEASIEGVTEAILNDRSHFGWVPVSERKKFLEMELPKLCVIPKPFAIRQILANLIKQIKASPDEWESVKPRVDEKAAKVIVPKASKRLLDEYLFRPCAEYERVLGELLSSARFDSMSLEEGKEFLAEDEEFYLALVSDRICKRVLSDQSNLNKVLADMWEDAIRSSN